LKVMELLPLLLYLLPSFPSSVFFPSQNDDVCFQCIQGEALAELLRLPQCNLRTLKVSMVSVTNFFGSEV